MVAFTHRLDIVWDRAIVAYELFEMGPPIVVDVIAPPYFDRRVLVTLAEPNAPGEYHGMVVVDDQLVRDELGVPIYDPVWRTMFTVAAKPAAIRPDEATGTETTPGR